MNAVVCLNPCELRALIHWHAGRRDQAVLMYDRSAIERHAARILELERMLPERQYEPSPEAAHG